jgi:hypothetical protein
MKKIILCLGLIAVSLASCSSDDSGSSDNSSDVLVRKVVYNAITDDYTETVQYTYNGNKLVKGVYDDGSVETYTYTGDLITKMEYTEDGELIYKETFSYDGSGRLTEYHALEDGYDDQETFVYNNDGTVTSTIGTGVAAMTRTLHFQNDELVQIVGGGETYNYTYDAKNSPFGNVTGYAKIATVVHGDHEFFGAKQNISTIHEVTNDVDYMTNTMTYNSADYPTSVSSVAVFESDGTYTATVQYTY